jgi:beta-glucosidase
MKKMLKREHFNKQNMSKLLTLMLLIPLLTNCRAEIKPVYADITSPADERTIDSLVSIMSLEEKVAMLCGNSLFTSPGVERLGIRELHYTDGPFGIREELDGKTWAPLGLTTDSATFFPTGSALAATWNLDLSYRYGLGMGEEAKSRKKDILLGPAVNITRSPLNGRTYEYMSEDPFLNARLAVNYVKGVQSAGVAACVKHYAVNNQETLRGTVDVNMDERTLREIYLPAFKAAVTEGGAYAVMSAYNKFRNYYCGENDYLLNKILREEWNFKGMVMSDWGGTHSTVGSAMNGLDVEMGTALYFKSALADSVKAGLVPESVIDEKVKSILRLYLFSIRKPKPEGSPEISTPEHNKIAYDVASQSIVLLKNSRNILPLKVENLKTIAVIGENAIQTHAQGGFGAGVKARVEITPLKGLQQRLGNSIKIEFAQGYRSKFVAGKRFVPDNSPDQKLIDEAVKKAANADAVLLFVGNTREVETESVDRQQYQFPFSQDNLIRAVCSVNPNTVIIIVAGAPSDLNVADSSASALVWSWFNGSQAGTALADVLTGRINPSGRLPFTIPAKLNDSPAHSLGIFPGDSVTTYAEGIFVGYRWFDNNNITPKFPFGYGLSYTDFEYSDLAMDRKKYGSTDSIRVSLNISNTGKRDGSETVQIYVSQPDAPVQKPVRELKAFKKVAIPAGESAKVNLLIAVADLAWFDEDRMAWTVSPGKYLIAAGKSSRDIHKIAEIEIK